MENIFTSAQHIKCLKKILGATVPLLLLLFCACGSEPTPTFTVTFYTNGGTPVVPQTVESGQKATEPYTDPTKEGYTFKGWFTEATGGTAFDFSKAITAETAVYAQWVVVQTFTVTFDTQGGTPVDSQTIDSSKTATIPADPTKEGYTFVGWFTEVTGGAEFNFSEAITAETAVYAHWIYAVLTNENRDELISYDESTKTFTVHEGVEEIDYGAFIDDPREITKIVFPSTLIRIGANAFVSGELTSVDIPTSVETIGEYAFYGNKISSLTLGSGVESIGNYAFQNNQIEGDLVIPDSVKTIGESAFISNQISSLTLGSGVVKVLGRKRLWQIPT